MLRKCKLSEANRNVKRFCMSGFSCTLESIGILFRCCVLLLLFLPFVFGNSRRRVALDDFKSHYTELNGWVMSRGLIHVFSLDSGGRRRILKWLQIYYV